MAANGGLAEPRENETTKGDERPAQPASPLHTMNARHLRIVHSADGCGSLSHPLRVLAPHNGRGPGAVSNRSSGASQGMLDRSIQGQIGRMLRDVFSDVASEPVPARFVELLEALAAREEE
jgi:hypothetical protein